MATLWNRATVAQSYMLRAVAGAVRNTADAHRTVLPHNFDRSVAKRAVGTLSALNQPEALAAITSRQEGLDETSAISRPKGSQYVKGPEGGRHTEKWRSPLFCISYEISRKMWAVTDPVAREAYIDVLRLLAKEQDKLK